MLHICIMSWSAFSERTLHQPPVCRNAGRVQTEKVLYNNQRTLIPRAVICDEKVHNYKKVKAKMITPLSAE